MRSSLLAVLLRQAAAFAPRGGAPRPRALARFSSDADMVSLEIVCDAEAGGLDPDALSEFLMEIGALSVSVTDSHRDNPAREQAIFREPVTTVVDAAAGRAAVTAVDGPTADELWEGRRPQLWTAATLTSMWPAGWSTDSVSDAIASTFEVPRGDVRVTARGAVDARDWVEHVQSLWRPIRLGAVCVEFPWHREDAPAGGHPECAGAACSLVLEGGAAFGTGEHPTTAMCCEWLQRRPLSAQGLVCDYGAGSGVLGIAALRLGRAARAIGIEIDLDAIASARRNAAANDVGAAFDFFLPAASTAGHDVAIAFDKLKGPYRDAAAPSTPSLPEQEYAGACDLVVANILAGPLLALAPAIARLAKPGGALALSGVLVAQADDVCAAFRDAGFADARVAEEREGWVLIEGTYRET